MEPEGGGGLNNPTIKTKNLPQHIISSTTNDEKKEG